MVLSHCEIPRILVVVERKGDQLPRKQVYDLDLRHFIVVYLARAFLLLLLLDAC